MFAAACKPCGSLAQPAGYRNASPGSRLPLASWRKAGQGLRVTAAAAGDAAALPPPDAGGDRTPAEGPSVPLFSEAWGPEVQFPRARKAMDTEIKEKMDELQRRLSLAESQLQIERERAAALAPYRVAAPKRGVIGNSRYAQALRRQIVQASRDPQRRPVLIFGEPGLEKDNLAALIHFGSKYHDAPFVQLDCDRLDDNASDLFGAGRKKGLLAYLPREGTLLLNNIHKAPKSVFPLLQQTVDTVSRSSMDEDSDHPSVFPRIILTAETAQPQLSDICAVIKVPPLRVRPADIRAMQAFFLNNIKRQRDMGRVSLTDEAVRRLESYSYPYNVVELQTMVERAAVQSAGAGKSLTEDVFWFATQAKDSLRYNLLKVPLVRRFLRSSLWPNDINFGFTVYAFAGLVALLFLAPQDRSHNFGLNLFWCYWWPASFIIYPFLGRVWCAVCPFMIYGELVQRWRLSQGAQLLKWPRELMDQWGAWFLFGLFAVILVWEEVWDLPNTAYLSSWLLLIITFGAMVGSWFFERRIWCRYLCPIGGMNGLFAKLSMTELRARQGVCSSTCTTYTCFKGGPAVPPEGMESDGCPVYSHPAQLVDNRNCVLCMECLKACPHRSIEFRLRLPGVDLWTSHKPMAAEVCLMFMLLGAVYLHDADDLLLQFGVDPTPFMSTKLPYILLSTIFLAMPGVIAWGVDALWRWSLEPRVRQRLAALRRTLPMAATDTLTDSGSSMAGSFSASVSGSMDEAQARAISVLQASIPGAPTSGAGAAAARSGRRGPSPLEQEGVDPKGSQLRPRYLRPFVELAYGYLPLVWAGTLAYYLDNAFEEAGLILPVTAATFGYDAPWLPTFVVAPVVTEFLQGSTLLFGAALSLVLTRKLGEQPWKNLLPQCAVIALFTVQLWALILPN